MTSKRPEDQRRDFSEAPATQYEQTPTRRTNMQELLQAEGGGTCPSLVVIQGDGIGQRHSLYSGTLRVGRADTCGISIDDDASSRVHCQFETNGSTTVARDLGSMNGTFVNDERVTQKTLADGDTVTVGHTIFKFLGMSNPEAAYFEEVHRLMTTDPLTGAMNRRAFDEDLARCWYEARRYDRPFSLLMLDIDHFKRVNDTYGHQAGDQVLARIGALVGESKRFSDRFCRYGGEEFALLLPQTSLANAYILAERIRLAIGALRFTHEDKTFGVTVSIGMSDANASLETHEAMVKVADDRLYEAKHGGRNQVVPAPASPEEA